MMDDKYWPRGIDEIEDKVSLINEPLAAPEGTTALPTVYRQPPLHGLIAGALANVEALIERLELGVRAQDNERALVRELYVQCRRQREVLAAALRLELE
jgi:hypothetical protein